jgi:hypothetical protein
MLCKQKDQNGMALHITCIILEESASFLVRASGFIIPAGFIIPVSNMLLSPKYMSNFRMQNSSKSTLTYVFLAQWDMSLEESFAEDV